MKEDEPAIGDDGTAEPLADRLRPHDLRAARSPGVGERGSTVDAVALCPQVLRPVGNCRLRAERERDEDWKRTERYGHATQLLTLSVFSHVARGEAGQRGVADIAQFFE